MQVVSIRVKGKEKGIEHTVFCGRGLSSLPSKRLDIRPDHVPLVGALEFGVALFAEPPAVSVRWSAPTPAMYIAALPFPGLAAGTRFTITDDEGRTFTPRRKLPDLLTAKPIRELEEIDSPQGRAKSEFPWLHRRATDEIELLVN